MRGRHARPSVKGDIAGQAARIAPVFAVAGTMLGMPHRQPPPARTIPAERVLHAELTASVEPASPDQVSVVQAGRLPGMPDASVLSSARGRAAGHLHRRRHPQPGGPGSDVERAPGRRRAAAPGAPGSWPKLSTSFRRAKPRMKGSLS
jgi:hypothetical protein